jgi:hypothetical protein
MSPIAIAVYLDIGHKNGVLMRRTLSIFLGALCILTLTASVAFAANVHFKKSPAVHFTDNGTSLSVSGALTGLGGGDVVITLTATGTPTATCTNPAGATQPAGRTPVDETLTGVQEFPSGQVKNGNLTFTDVKTGSPPSPVAGAPECPNPNWREDITDVAFTSATITVYQPCSDITLPIDCAIVLQQTFTAPLP